MISSVISTQNLVSWSDNNLTNGTKYYYKITAVDNSGNESLPTAEVSATPFDIFVVRTVKKDGSGDHTSISDAIMSSSNGDTIKIYAGVYEEPIGTSKNIHFIGEDSSNTIISWENGGVFVMGDGQTSYNTLIKNLTIRDGRSDTWGGVALHDFGSVVLDRVRLINNSTIPNDNASNDEFGINTGAGINIYNTTVTIKNSYIGLNTSQNGGGVKATSATLTIDNSIIEDNTVSGEGGGVLGRRNSTIIITNSKIMNNTSIGSGAGLYLDGGSLNITNSVFANNSSTINEGGAISLQNGNSVIFNSTFTNNTAGGNDNANAIRLYQGSILTILNSIFWGNGSQNFGFSDQNESSTLNLDFSLVQGALTNGSLNIDVNNNGAVISQTPASIIDVDPKFKNVSLGDYSLSNSSPAVGVGTQSLSISGTTYNAPTVDINGIQRPSPSGSNPDLGAYESLISVPGPMATAIYDGTSNDTNELDYTNSSSTLSAYWDPFSSSSSFTYYYALGTTAKNNIVDWTSNGTSTSATLTGLSLENNVNYFISVFAINSEGSTSDTISTDGIMIDTQAPVISSVSESDWYGVGKNAQVAVIASDNGLIANYDISVGTTTGSDNVISWFKSDTNHITIDISSLSENIRYYSNVRATDILGNVSNIVSSNGFELDLTAPIKGMVETDSYTDKTDEMNVTWSGFSDSKSGLSHYEYSLGTQAGAGNIVVRTNTGLSESVKIENLTLEDGQTYYGTEIGRAHV